MFIAYPSFWTWLIAVFVIAGGQHGLALIAHEACGLLVWPQNKRTSDCIGTYLFAAPTALVFNVHRQRHVIHHRLVSQRGDTKNVYRRDWCSWLFSFEVVKSLSGIEYLVKVKDALKIGKGDEYETFDAHLRHNQIGIIGVNAIIFFFITLFDPMHYDIPTYYFILWLWPMVTLTLLFAKIRALIERQLARNGMCEADETPCFLNTPGLLLRSVRASWVEHVFLPQINIHYHAEHHLWPWISCQYLLEMNARIWKRQEGEQSLLINSNLVVVGDSYTAGTKDVICGE